MAATKTPSASGIAFTPTGTVAATNVQAAIAEVAAEAGAGSAPITREELDGPNLLIADGDTGALGWSNGGSPDSLLDLTTPTSPTVITAGVYCFTVTVAAFSTLSVGGLFRVQLQLDRSGFNASQYVDSRVGVGVNLSPLACITFPWYMPAGAKVEVWVTNLDGGALDKTFSIYTAHVQRLS